MSWNEADDQTRPDACTFFFHFYFPRILWKQVRFIEYFSKQKLPWQFRINLYCFSFDDQICNYRVADIVVTKIWRKKWNFSASKYFGSFPKQTVLLRLSKLHWVSIFGSIQNLLCSCVHWKYCEKNLGSNLLTLLIVRSTGLGQPLSSQGTATRNPTYTSKETLELNASVQVHRGTVSRRPITNQLISNQYLLLFESGRITRWPRLALNFRPVIRWGSGVPHKQINE